MHDVWCTVHLCWSVNNSDAWHFLLKDTNKDSKKKTGELCVITLRRKKQIGETRLVNSHYKAHYPRLGNGVPHIQRNKSDQKLPLKHPQGPYGELARRRSCRANATAKHHPPQPQLTRNEPNKEWNCRTLKNLCGLEPLTIEVLLVWKIEDNHTVSDREKYLPL